MGRATLFGLKLPDAHIGYVLYAVTIVVAAALALLARIYFDSTRGLRTSAVRENELRVEYLGGSVRQAMTINFVLAAFAGGAGGALTVMSLGHIDPNFSYWTTSGEFVFVAILAGWQSVLAVFVALGRARGGALLLEPVLPEHLAAGARPVPAVRDPLPAARHRLAVVGAAMNAHAPLLHASKLEKRFGAVVAASEIEMSVAVGERVSLIGSNGAGKTTLVNMITGYLKPDAGRISFDGRDITPLAPRAITRLGVARSFQIPQLHVGLSVLENMLVAVACHDDRLSFWQGARRARRGRARRRLARPLQSCRARASAASPSCPAACASCSTSPWR